MRQNLIKARKEKNYIQKDVSDILRISERQYQRLENGTSDGSVKLWLKLRDILNISIDDLLEQVEDTNSITK